MTRLGMLFAALVVAIGCGPNNAMSNNSNNAMSNNSMSNNSNNAMSNNSMSNNSNNAMSNNAMSNNSNNAMSNNSNNAMSNNSNNAMGCVPFEPTSVMPGDAGPATVLTSVAIDGSCCFDYDGDGESESSLGENLEGFEAETQALLGSEIMAGCVVLALEHDGITDLADSPSYTLNFHLAHHEAPFEGLDPSGNNISIDPASLDGANPRHTFVDATVSGGTLVADAGTAEIPIQLGGARVNLPLDDARIEAEVDSARSDLTGGIALSSGKLGGVVGFAELATRINDFVQSDCDCLDTTDFLDPATGQCDEPGTSACEAAGNTACVELAGSCGLFGAIPLFADVDQDGDGIGDAISFGATFAGAPATITGVSVD